MKSKKSLGSKGLPVPMYSEVDQAPSLLTRTIEKPQAAPSRVSEGAPRAGDEG